ncbi:hypothetical protein [Sabulicella rubraurantiaca]|uniref:hypothetical protein n=1 Tax=Sabulicella rubraurantiaca TaxID=2811429 RepID=UPI001A95AD46|nr:hypothetical protein [Sabulicella rubraurantiaca]
MRLPLLILPFLLLASGAEAQRGGPHDGLYEGTRFQDCGRAGGRVGQARVVGEVRDSRITIPGLPGDPPLEGEIGSDGKVALPGFGLFQAGEGQIFEGANNARRFVSSHPGRGRCRLVHEMLRQRPSGR